MRIELRNDAVLLDGYVNAIERDSKIMLDEKGERFVEQIKPKVFQRAIEKNEDIFCLLNHDHNRQLGSTKQGNVELFEDNIGLRAICKITDSEVMQKAKEDKLRGWSFGFELLKEVEEPIKEGLKRRFVEEMNLTEISIIDDRKMPCYVGTSIEMRAEKNSKIEYRGRVARASTFAEKFYQNNKLNSANESLKLSKNLNANLVRHFAVYENILKQIKGEI
ncbi:MAG: HK97 family phage prohead protease [Candidatus Paraimprobicoccus trichonymphae]|uniref:HK97 family phage prohead protease n=1 Tax=Candidatus Paraimprobicoccus trichonymphae TaxID=3033793 RepID=A0AA48L047_9FIRM|nr:MAG: HK97 family phage prohead protease [Candidatus Paraimprobicoccus trichonymphae]